MALSYKTDYMFAFHHFSDYWIVELGCQDCQHFQQNDSYSFLAHWSTIDLCHMILWLEPILYIYDEITPKCVITFVWKAVKILYFSTVFINISNKLHEKKKGNQWAVRREIWMNILDLIPFLLHQPIVVWVWTHLRNTGLPDTHNT